MNAMELGTKFNATRESDEDDDRLVDGGISSVLLMNFVLCSLLGIVFFALRLCWPKMYVRSPSSVKRTAVRTVAQFPFGWVVAPFLVLFVKSERSVRISQDTLVLLVFKLIILVVSIVIMVLTMGLCLPVNISGGALDKTSYATTTIENMPKSSDWYWIHIGVLIALSVVVCCAMLVFYLILRRLGVGDHLKSFPVVKVEGLPPNLDGETVLRSLWNVFGHRAIERFDLVRDWRKYEKLVKKRSIATKRFVSFSEEDPAALVSSSIAFWKRSPAVEYYEEQIKHIDEQLDELRGVTPRSFGAGFIVCSSRRHAERVVAGVRTHRLARLRGSTITILPSDSTVPLKKLSSSLVDEPPADQRFSNLRFSPKIRYTVRILFSIVFLVWIFVFSSPAMFIAYLKHLVFLLDKDFWPSGGSAWWIPLHSILFGYFPALILHVVEESLPGLIALMASLEMYISKAREESAFAVRLFWYNFIGIVVFPSLQGVSLSAFVGLLNSSDNDDHESLLQRIGHRFFAQSGSYFINYLIELALVGSILVLLRYQEVLKYCAKRLYCTIWRRSTRDEVRSLPETVSKEFDFAESYVWWVIVLALSVIYSVASPCLSVVCVAALVIRCLVENYMIMFANFDERSNHSGPKRFNVNLLKRVIQYTLFSLGSAQLVYLCYFLTKSDRKMWLVVLCLKIATWIFTGTLMATWNTRVRTNILSRKRRSRLVKEVVAREEEVGLIHPVDVPRSYDWKDLIDNKYGVSVVEFDVEVREPGADDDEEEMGVSF